MKRQAFTLVELIVVITILAILGTIGFISLQGFSSDARDSKRISEIGEIRSGLQIYQARNSLVPTPSEQIVTIGSGSTDLIIQGYAGVSVLNEIRMNGDPKDPLEKEYYTYSVNASKTKFQLLALLENDNNLISFNNLNIIPTTHASYLNRFPYTVGGGIVGIILDDTTNTPIQKLTTSVDLNTDTNNYKVVFLNNNEVLTLSGELLYAEIITQTNNNGVSQTQNPNPYLSCTSENTPTPFLATTIYPGCNEADIIVCSGNGEGYTISSCNVGATIASQDWALSGGEYFQWGRNKGFAYNDLTQESTQIANASYDPNNDENGFVWNSNLSSYRFDWIVNQDDNLWGNNSGTGTDEQRQGPCASGYHVPSQTEWAGIVTSGGWGTDGISMQIALNLPYAGFRHWDNGVLSDEGLTGGYWSSTPNDAYGYLLHLYSSNIVPNNYTARAIGFSVRCFKN